MKFFVIFVVCLLVSQTTISQALQPNPEQLRRALLLEKRSQATGDSALLAHAYYKFGHTYSFAGDNVQAKRYYIKALQILQDRPPSYDLGHIYVRLCEVLSVNPQSNQEIEYLNKAIDIFTRINSSKGLAMAYGMLQGAYGGRWIGKIKENPAYLDTLLTLGAQELRYAKICRDTSFIVDAYVRNANVYCNLGDVKKTLNNLNLAMKAGDACGNDTVKIRALLGFSDTYLHIKKPDLALPYIQEVERIYKKNDYQQFFILRHFMQSRVHYYQLNGDWQKAFQQANLVYNLLNATDLANYDKTTTQMDQELQIQKASLQLHSEMKENKLNQQLVNAQYKFIVVICTLLVVSGIIALFLYLLYTRFRKLSKRYKHISHVNQEMVKEQNHRVKNNLQMVSNLLSMHARQLSDSDAKQAILESKLRVQTMTIIQRKLYDSLDTKDINLSDFIPELVDEVLFSCGTSAVDKEISIEPILLDVDRVITIGLMITELIVNASKYAFLGHSSPKVIVNCKSQQDHIVLRVEDNGIEQALKRKEISKSENFHAAHTTERTQFGTQLIELLAKQLDATFDYSKNQSSTKFNMRFAI
jgi:two-component sensor histidine kinase